MTRFRQTLLVLLLTILSGATVAQNNTNSPYTRYGYGQLADQGSGNSKAMGGIAYGLRDKYQTNFANPASYTAVDSLTFMFDGGISMQNTNFSDGTVKKNAKNSSFDYITMQFRLSKWGAMSIGLLPYSNVGYTMASYQENTEYPENSAALLGNTKLKKIKDLKTPTESSGLIEAGQKEDTTKEGYLITFKTNPLKGSEVYKGVVEYKEQLGLAVCVNGMKYESRKALDIKKTYNTPLIIDDFAKYDYFDYPTTPEELDGFKLGEVVYDQCGEIGVILAFHEKNGTARLNSNGCCDVGNLKKCPTEIAEREVKHMDIIRPEKSLPSYATAKYYDKKVI